MKSQRITNGSAAAVATLVIMTNGYSFISGSNAGGGAWISHLIAGALSILLIWCFTCVADSFPQKSFYEICEFSLGKRVGGAVSIFFAVIAVFSCVVSLTIFSRFVQITALPQTPQIIIPLIIALISAYSATQGLYAISGAGRLLVWFFGAVFILFAVLGISNADFYVAIPFFSDINVILRGAGEAFLSRFGSILAMMALYTRMDGEKSRRRFFFGAIAGSTVALSCIALLTASTLGKSIMVSDFYPAYTAMSVGSVGGFIRHTEVFACIAMTLSLFFKSALCIFFADEMLQGTFGADSPVGAKVPLALIAAALTQILYRDSGSLRRMVEWKPEAAIVALIYIVITVAVFFLSKLKKQ